MKILLPPDLDGQRQLIESHSRQLLIVGANGSGKTRFTDYLINDLGEKAYCLSGLDALYGSRNPKDVHRGSIDSLFAAMTDSSPMFNSETRLPLDKLIALLLNDEILNLIKYKVELATDGKARLKSTRLDRVIRAWQSIFPSNRILVESGRLLFQRNDNMAAYSSMRLSDGERAALYYLGAVLYAPENAIVFIDNPATFLHPTVSNLIWDKVEQLRPDCSFIYTTHDLEFASTRTGSTVVWVQDFDPKKLRWSYSRLSDHGDIPEDVYLSIIGARKPVLFIEGVAERSIDYKLYTLIFPEFTDKSLGSCNKVIESVRSFNDLNAFHHLDSYGIVDRDRRDRREVEYLRNKKILVPEVAEVENLLMLENVIRAVARYRHRDENRVFTKVKTSLFKMFRSEMAAQALEHTRHRVKRTVEFRIDGRFGNISQLESHIADLVKEINPRGIYKAIFNDFNKILSENDYNGLLRVFNDKTMINNSNVAGLCGLKNKEQYLSTILNILKSNSPEAGVIRSTIAGTFGL